MGTTMAAEFWGTVSSRAYRYMGHGCHPVRTSRREYVSHVSTVGMFLTLCSDTPWDEPTERSPEFCRYLSGEIFNEEPWTNFSTNALCTLTLRLLWRRPNLLYSSDLWHVDPGIREAHDHVRNLCTSLVCKVSRNSDGKLSLTPIRPSQLATRGVHALAEQLSQSLRENGDLMYANPDISGARSVHSSLQLAPVDLTCLASSRKDADGDEIMSSAQSQFTQSLLLFVSLPPCIPPLCRRSPHPPDASPKPRAADGTPHSSPASTPRSDLASSSTSSRKASTRSRSNTRTPPSSRDRGRCTDFGWAGTTSARSCSRGGSSWRCLVGCRSRGRFV